jgi:NADP-dependent 3-hydroxy acid dehydrogenase YdfG
MTMEKAMFNTDLFDGQVVVIAGAAGGVGEAIA